jgi:Lipopolysaccharide kinase (Kdo/WaaP) family
MLTGRVIRDGLSYVLRGGLHIKNGHLPQKNHHIPDNYFGICVASSADPTMDAYVISQVKALGIKRVRLDFSYADFGNNKLSNFNARFLRALISRNLQVTLHIIQPFSAAKNMQNAAEQVIWREFLEAVLDTFGSQVAQIEIGTTINRKRWAGYTFDGFLCTWSIAHQAIKARNIVLVGPNVQDFEPLYNISFLKIFKQKNQLPDIHSNNLFAERTVEPERYDHRIFKYSWATFFKVNLIKKARILQKIGADFGVPHLVSSTAFWAMFRIGRILPDTGQKQADYAARYFTLLAASGSLMQANWGALICAREGLINNQLNDKDYPPLEQVTHYSQVNGALKNFQHYPSFAAVKTLVSMLQGAQYIAPIATANGLEIHHFVKDNKHIHVAWCINGKACLLHDIYGDALQGAQILARSGIVLARNSDFITESPIYLQFDSAPATQTEWQTNTLPNLVIHTHASQQYFVADMAGWQGLVLANNHAEAQTIMQKLNPNQLQTPQKDSALRHARNAIWAVQDPRNTDKQLTIKQPVKMYPHKALLDRFKPSKAKRSWNGAMELLRRGIDTAAPVAYFEKIGDSSLKQNFYICEFVPAETTVGQLFSAFSRGESSWNGIAADDILKQVAQFCLTMHQRLVFFRDLSGGNILVSVDKNNQNQLQFSLIDTARLRCVKHTPFPRQYRLADMSRACHKLDWPNRERLMAYYFAGIGSSFSWRDKLSFYLYDFKVGLKRKIGRKGIKRLIKRIKGQP